MNRLLVKQKSWKHNMTPEQILDHPARVLTQSQREHYFEHGYIDVQELIPHETLDNLISETNDFVEQSRGVVKSDNQFDVGSGHSAQKAVLRRLKCPDERSDVYWDFATGLIADVAADLAGPNVVFHHSKLNFKWFDPSDVVKWHQDIQFFPHTNYNVFTIGCYLADTTMQNGPLAVVKGSHAEELYNQYDKHGNWTGMLSDEDASNIDMSRVQYLPGKAGSITIHNCRTLHHSPASKSPLPRPLLLNCYSSADAKAYTPHPSQSCNSYKVIRGKAELWAQHDPRPCQIPPDWSGGYTSIYAAQAGEDTTDGSMM
jgi:ectoine hydroxylase